MSATRVWRLDDIIPALERVDVVGAMARAFAAYSEGRAVVPPVGELLFTDPPGDAHIKYGYIAGDDIFVIKIATGFYQNPGKSLPANSGLMAIFNARTGLPDAILLDEGHLTNVRTAAAGALAARELAPTVVHRIGIIGAGVQARTQLRMLASVTPCRAVDIFARDPVKAEVYARDMRAEGFAVSVVDSPSAVARNCNLIVTATASNTPLLHAADIQPGTHINAMGSDTPDKNELAPDVLAAADLVVADSLSQCQERGEIHHANALGSLSQTRIVELGDVVRGVGQGRFSDDEVTVCDLTGVAVQDIEICKAVLAHLSNTPA